MICKNINLACIYIVLQLITAKGHELFIAIIHVPNRPSLRTGIWIGEDMIRSCPNTEQTKFGIHDVLLFSSNLIDFVHKMAK